MSGLAFFLIPVGLFATTAFLGFGIYALARGGTFSKNNANKLMRLRVAAQAATVAILIFVAFVARQGGA